MRKVLYVLGGIALLVGIVIALVFWMTSGAVEAAEEFLALVAEGKTHEAYLSTAGLVQSQQSESDFVRGVESLGLTRYESASWHNRSMNNNRGTLEGTIETVDGATIPLTVELVHEQDEWRVLTITGPQAGTVQEGARSLPSDSELKELVRDTLVNFNQAHQSGDFTAFHGTISTLWQSQISPQQFKEVFQEFDSQQIDMSALSNLEPVFDQPPSKDGEVLNLSGYYPTSPTGVRFGLKYIYEHPRWKLFGIHLAPQGISDEVLAQDDSSPGEDLPAPAGSAQDIAPGEGFRLVANEQLKGRLGRLLVSFPEGSNPSSTRIEVVATGGNQAAASGYGKLEVDLLPGRYDTVISGRRVPGVEIMSGHDTHLLVGVLRVTAGSSTRVSILGEGDEEIASGYGSHEFGLPVGAYQVQVAGQKEPVLITEGTITEF